MRFSLVAATVIAGCLAQSANSNSNSQGTRSIQGTQVATPSATRGASIPAQDGSQSPNGSGTGGGTYPFLTPLKIHAVSVGKNPVNNSTGPTYYPNKIEAAVGDMVQFVFAAGNHTVTQSSFDKPCQRMPNGIYSGFVPAAASAAKGELAVYTVRITNKKPMWFYCSQGKHCQGGMVMVINENTAANSTRSLDNFKALAAGSAASNSDSSGTPSGTTPAAPDGTKASSSQAASGATSSVSSLSCASSFLLLSLVAAFMLR